MTPRNWRYPNMHGDQTGRRRVTASINTERIDLRINPTRRRADRRLQRLTAAQYGAYVELLEEAVLSNSKTGSEFVDGDFSREHVLEWCAYVTVESLGAMERVGIVEQVEGDRYRIDFTGQTAHFELLMKAETNAERAATQRANCQARREARLEEEESAERRRAQGAERSRRYRARQAAAPRESEESDAFGGEAEFACVTGPHRYDYEDPGWG
jgi:hypothetical protein